MILKCSDEARSARIGYQCFSARCAPFLTEGTPKCSEKINKQACELVKFDFAVTAEQTNLNEFEGVFMYDTKSNSYRWHINSVSPRSQHIQHDHRPLMSRNPSGDYSEKLNISPTKNCTFIHEDPPENTMHFTTPCASLLDNTKHVINPRTELHSCSPPLTTLNSPSDTESIDDLMYRRLESLGFRRRTIHTSLGTHVRANKGRSTLSSPRFYFEDTPLQTESTAKLTIKNLDPMAVPPPSVIPYKRQGFTPRAYKKNAVVLKR